MVLSLNATRICLHILRDGLLDTRLFLGRTYFNSSKNDNPPIFVRIQIPTKIHFKKRINPQILEFLANYRIVDCGF